VNFHGKYHLANKTVFVALLVNVPSVDSAE